MEGFTYQNIFETKGIEYILIIGFLIILIPFWLILSKRIKASRFLQNAVRSLTLKSIKVPQGMFFSRFHTWAHLEESGIARVGPDDFLLHITGPMTFEPVKMPGDPVKKGELMAILTRNEKHLRIYSPVSGKIMEENRLLHDDSDLLALDPYGKGWFYKIKPTHWIDETQSYYQGEKATYWTSHELFRFKNWLTGPTVDPNPLFPGVVLQDGGELVDQPLSELPENVWTDFQKKFLNEHPVS